jgi:5,10-methylenetetrahydromethanopterin reductase
MDVGLLLFAEPRRLEGTARLVEELGFHSLVLPDSQNLAPEVWGQLMLAARATTRIRLGPGVTNSITRDPAVTASAAVSLQVASEGRAVLGIGRGDSSVQRIGRAQDPVGHFAAYLAAVQGYLRGEAVDRDGFPSRLEWLPRAGVAKVPVEVAATGPRVIEAAVRHADRLCLAVGADPEHVAEKLAFARRAADAAGRDPASLRYGAYVTCVLSDDVGAAREAVRGSATTFARFSALPGSRLERLPPPLRRAAEYIRTHYDMRDHTRTGVAHTAGIADEFVDWFAIAGPVADALPRFRQLAALGLDFVHVIAGSTGMPREMGIATLSALARDVLPALRSA